jgi:predicted regulator of Ras-like GTPase activity (Roadblock/LC7/MglB family)
MTPLDQALSRLMDFPGVEHLLLLGQDGLLVRHLHREEPLEAETVAAMTPGVVAACTDFARSAGRGAFATAVLELADAVAIVSSLPPELLLAIILRPGVGFAPLLRELGQERTRLATLV